MDETTITPTGGDLDGLNKPAILLGIAMGFLVIGIYAVLAEISFQLQELNHCLSKVFLTFPLSLQELKDLEAQIGVSSQEDPGQENHFSHEES